MIRIILSLLAGLILGMLLRDTLNEYEELE